MNYKKALKWVAISWVIKYPIIALIIGVIYISNLYGSKSNIERIINPDLPVLKGDWQGNIVVNGRFSNDSIPKTMALGKAAMWAFSPKPQRKEKRKDTFQLQVLHFDISTMQENSIVWLGHATFLIDINGVRIIIDPCFLDMRTYKRKIPLPCSVDMLKPIHYMLISHEHIDHFDKGSINTLAQNNPDMEALLPLGITQNAHDKNFEKIKRQEAGWYQEYNLNEDFRIVFLPARHWGRVGLKSRNKTLWGSYLIIANNTKIFFAGDTAYDEQMFKDIHNLFGDIDICILPIGAYSPESLISFIHTTPEESVQVFKDLGGRLFIPMHYGTYNANEPPGEPIKRLFNSGINEQIKIIVPGEEFLFLE